MIDITFLGTGSAVPTAKRNHTGIVLKYKAEMFLFDCGEGIQRQFRKAKMNPCSLTRLFISHWHGDHVLGIPGLLQTLALNGYNKKLEIYGPRGTKKFLKKMMGLFVPRGDIEFSIKEFDSGKVVETDDFEIVCEQMDHGTPTLAYSFLEKDRLRIDKKKLEKYDFLTPQDLKKISQGRDVSRGKKVRAKDLTYLQKGKKVTIVLDTKENLRIKKIAKNADLFICEATYLDNSKFADEYKHLTILQACAIAKAAKVKKLILTHMSQRFESSVVNLEETAKKKFKNSELARDLMKIEIK